MIVGLILLHPGREPVALRCRLGKHDTLHRLVCNLLGPVDTTDLRKYKVGYDCYYSNNGGVENLAAKFIVDATKSKDAPSDSSGWSQEDFEPRGPVVFTSNDATVKLSSEHLREIKSSYRLLQRKQSAATSQPPGRKKRKVVTSE